MLIDVLHSQTGTILRVKVRSSSSPFGGLTGLTSGSAGLRIGTIADVEATATAYTGSNLETVTTLGTYEAPTAGKARFREVDATNHPGVYEVHLANARYAVAAARSLLVSLSGVVGMAECDAVVPLRGQPARDERPGGRIWYVTTTGSDFADGLSPVTAKANPKTTIEAAAAGDLVRIGAGQFDLVEAVINVPAGVAVQGSGWNDTSIISKAPLSTAGCIVRPGSDSVISDLSIVGVRADGIAQGCLGYNIRAGLTQPAYTNAEARRLRLSADTDGIYQNNALTPGQLASLRCYDCLVEVKYDAVFHAWGSGTLDLYDCHLRVTGPSADGGQDASGIAARTGALGGHAPTTRMYGGSISVTGATVSNAGVEFNMPGGRVELHGVLIQSSGAGALDIKRSSGTVVVSRVAYDPTKVTGGVSTLLPAANLSADERGAMADKFLYRSLVGGADGVQGGRIVLEALRPGRNKVVLDVPAPGQFTVFKEDDTTVAWTGTYTRGANTLGPLTGVDPG